MRHRLVARFAPYLRPQRGLVAASTAALLGTTLTRLLEPWPLAFVIDRLLAGAVSPSAPAAPDAAASASAATAGGPIAAAVAGFGTLSPGLLLAACAASIVVIALVKASLGYASTIGFARIGQRVIGDVRADLFRHLQTLSIGWHQQRRTGELSLRLTQDIAMLKESTVTALLPMAANVGVLAGMLGVMLWLDPVLAALAMLPLPILAWVTLRSASRLHGVSRESRQREGAIAATASEALGAIRTVQSLAIENRIAERFSGAERRSQKDGVRAKRLAAGMERSAELLLAVAVALVLWQGAREVLAGALSAGELLVFITYLKNTFRPVRDQAKHAGRLSKSLAAAERIADLFDVEPAVRDRADAIEAARLRGEIELSHVGFHYPGVRRAVFDGLDLRLAAGERIAIVGASGTGKSTLTSLLLRLFEPQSGELRIDGVPIERYTLASLRRQIALLPQEPLVFAASVHENIALGLPGTAPREAVVAAARQAQAHAFIERLPQGYDTVLGERGATLSGGQRQRLAIARALLRDSPIVLLDEPTTGLDSHHRAAVVEALQALTRGRTTLVVTHDLPLAAQADRVVVLADGRVAEDGPPQALLAAGGPYAALWRRSAPGAAAMAGPADESPALPDPAPVPGLPAAGLRVTAASHHV